MELKEFVKSVLRDLVSAVEETRRDSCRDMQLVSHKESAQTVEFDIAVTAEENASGSGRAGIKVFRLIEGGGDLARELKNASVSRIKFGVHIDTFTKHELQETEQRSREHLSNDSYEA